MQSVFGGLTAMALLGIAGTAPAQPAERVTVGDFVIDRTEVTIGQFHSFAAETGLVTAAEREGGGFEYAAGWERRPGWTV